MSEVMSVLSQSVSESKGTLTGWNDSHMTPGRGKQHAETGWQEPELYSLWRAIAQYLCTN